ncbi:hypothetical protein QTO34_008005 [Cnephaeus nilssonii]|uniref:glutamate decarboxylase n=1 Tax=Cnephaeus nilssonii TaxID=3371016 RepID=A0AA40I9J0_CNENI|nr:hypothetical protein QTO34_008005 [Eptesicus nilssonii]
MASPGSSFWSFGSEDGSGDPENPGTARAWCQVAQKFTGGIGNKLCALLYGDAEKPAESGGSEPPRATSRKAACACSQKPCSCPKADVNYAFCTQQVKAPSGPLEPAPEALPVRNPAPRARPPASRFTYEIAPVFVLLEYVTLKKMREIIGWPGGSGDGIFSPGI